MEHLLKTEKKNNEKNILNEFIIKIFWIGIIFFVVKLFKLNIFSWIGNLFNNINIGDNWIGFAGSLFGAIIGGTVTLIGINKTIKENRYSLNNAKKEDIERRQFEVSPHFVFELTHREEYTHINASDYIVDCDYLLIKATGFSKECIEEYGFENTINDIKGSLLEDKKANTKILDEGKFEKPLDYIFSQENNIFFLLTFENIGLNSATYLYIESIEFADIKCSYNENGVFYEYLESDGVNKKGQIRERLLSTGLKVGDKKGIVLSVYFPHNFEGKSIYLKLRYKDLLGNYQYIYLHIAVESVLADTMYIKSIKYPNNVIINF